MKRVLVVFKKSFLEAHAGEAGRLRRLPPAQRRRILRADVENRATLQAVVDFLGRQHTRVDVVDRASLAGNSRYELVVTVGGDGTFFMASHYVRSAPVLAVNSDPENSLGLFTCADRETFREPLSLALYGRLPVTRLNRLSVAINGATRRELVINDVLFAHRNPAAMSEYGLRVDGREETQRSSGIWIAAAAGSTAAIRAAGGRRMPIESRRIQYLVREPYGWPEPAIRLRHGEAKREIGILCAVREAGLWIDGARRRADLHLGDRVRIRTGAPPLLLLGYDDARRRRLFP